MTRVRVLLPAALAALLFVAVIAAGHALAGPGTPVATPLGPGDVTVTLTIHHSHFSPDHVSVRPGTTVRFVVHNTDPIGHELIVGDAEVHRRHEAGTEPVHPPRPGEISVPPARRRRPRFASTALAATPWCTRVIFPVTSAMECRDWSTSCLHE